MALRRIVSCLALLSLSLSGLVAACVGDDPVGSTADAAVDTSTSPTTTGTSTSGTDSAVPPTDGGTNADADAGGPKCGFPGEACCAAPFVACNVGTACASNRCVADDLWVVGDYVDISTFKHNGVSAHYDGTKWTAGPALGTDNIPYGVWGTAPDAYRAVTNRGKIWLLSGNRWLQCGNFGCSDPQTTAELYGINGFGGSDFWVGGVNVMYQCGGSTCTAKRDGLPATWGQGNFAGTSSRDLWYSQFDRAFHFNGTAWTIHPGIQARAIWARATNDVWGGDKQLQHYDGARWSQAYAVAGLPANPLITSISGTTTDDVWAVGYGGAAAFALHWDGAAWTKLDLPSGAGQVNSVFAVSKTEAYAVSFTGGIFKWDGAIWSSMTLPVMPNAGNWQSIFGSARARP